MQKAAAFFYYKTRQNFIAKRRSFFITKLILTKFIPAITDGIKIKQVERKILSLPAKYGGLAIPIFAEIQTTNTRTHSTSPNI